MDKLEQFKQYLIDYKDEKDSTLEMNLLLMRTIVTQIGEFTQDNIEQYILSLKRKDRQASTIRAHISLIHFWGECFRIYDAETYKFKGKLHQKPYKRGVFSEEETKAFLNLSNPFAKGCVYWKRFEMWTVFWYICAHQACRPGGAIRLRKSPIQGNKSHVDFGLNTITFDNKTESYTAPMAKIVREKLLAYLPTVEGDYLFPPLHKSKLPYMGCESWENDFTNRLERLIPLFPSLATRENLDPYSVRTTGATRWGRQNMQMKKIKELMGHKKITTTEKYMQFNMDDLQEAIDSDILNIPYFDFEQALAFAEKKNQELKTAFKDKCDTFIQSEPNRLVIVFARKK